MNERVRPLLGVVVGMLVGALFVGVLVVLLSIRVTQVDRGDDVSDTLRAAEAAEAGTDRIEDCTTPGRDCYERGQAQTAQAVANITRLSAYAATFAAACADLPGRQSVDEIERCVFEKLRAVANEGDR